MFDLGYKFPGVYLMEADTTLDQVDADFWASLETDAGVWRDYPVCEGSLFDWNCEAWNLWHFPSFLKTLHAQGRWLPGISGSYLYYGTKFTAFSWHIEDWDLYSANKLHFGAPKTWYTVGPAYARQLEYLGKHLYQPEVHIDAETPFRNKTLLITPDTLTECGIPYAKISNLLVFFLETYFCVFATHA